MYINNDNTLIRFPVKIISVLDLLSISKLFGVGGCENMFDIYTLGLPKAGIRS